MYIAFRHADLVTRPWCKPVALTTGGRLNHSCAPNLEFNLTWDEHDATVVNLGSGQAVPAGAKPGAKKHLRWFTHVYSAYGM